MFRHKPTPTFLDETRFADLEAKAELLSRTCDLALLTIREARGNSRTAAVREDMKRDLTFAVEQLRACRADVLAAL